MLIQARDVGAIAGIAIEQQGRAFMI